MIPILFEKSETKFQTNGIGRLDATRCMVSEKLNDAYELEMTIASSAKHSDEIRPGQLILAKPADGMRPQPFRIHKADRFLKGTTDVFARHISYDLSGYPVRGISVSSASAAVAALSSRAVIPSGFSFSTDLSVNATWEIPGAASIREAMGGDNGILGVYGGEWYYDRYTVSLLQQRGADSGVTIRYGKNMTELESVINDEEDYTGAFAFYYSGSYVGSNVIYDDQTAVPQKLLIVDHTSDFQSTPSQADLNALATADLAAAKGLTDSLTVSFVPSIEHVKLGDYVTVVYEKYRIRKKLRVVQTDYNVLLERYESIVLGEPKETLADTIANLKKG